MTNYILNDKFNLKKLYYMFDAMKYMVNFEKSSIISA